MTLAQVEDRPAYFAKQVRSFGHWSARGLEIRFHKAIGVALVCQQILDGWGVAYSCFIRHERHSDCAIYIEPKDLPGLLDQVDPLSLLSKPLTGSVGAPVVAVDS